MLGKMKAGWALIRGHWSTYPIWDWVGVAVVVVLHAIAVWKLDAGQLSDLVKADRMRFLQSVASVSALLFGFATASIAFFYGAARGDRVELLKKYFGKRLVASWRAALSAPLVAVAIALGALALDTGSSGVVWIGWVVEASVVVLALRSIRLRWLFTSTLTLMAVDADDESPKEYDLGQAPTVNPKYQTATQR